MSDYSYLEKLIGLSINSVHTEIEQTIPLSNKEGEKTEDGFSAYIQLYIGAYTLNIYNLFEILPTPTTNLKDLVGLKIIFTNETKEEAELGLDNGKTIKVNLRDEAYVGPEAMFMSGPDKLYVVWN